MPQAGFIVKAIDFSPLASAFLADTISNFNVTGFQPTTPACELTFLAPTSGIVRFSAQVSFQADSVNEFIRGDVMVRETDSIGTVIYTPSTADGQGIRWLRSAESPAVGLFETRYGRRILSGLAAGRLYWAQLQFSNVTTTGDLQDQNLSVVGIP